MKDFIIESKLLKKSQKVNCQQLGWKFSTFTIVENSVGAKIVNIQSNISSEDGTFYGFQMIVHVLFGIYVRWTTRSFILPPSHDTRVRAPSVLTIQCRVEQQFVVDGHCLLMRQTLHRCLWRRICDKRLWEECDFDEAPRR